MIESRTAQMLIWSKQYIIEKVSDLYDWLKYIIIIKEVKDWLLHYAKSATQVKN